VNQGADKRAKLHGKGATPRGKTRKHALPHNAHTVAQYASPRCTGVAFTFFAVYTLRLYRLFLLRTYLP